MLKFATYWNISSVGLEHYFDRVGVTGSSPVCSTFIKQYVTTQSTLSRGIRSRGT
jgi:hypothetical protein